MGGFFVNALSLTFQGFPSRTSEFIYMSCPEGKEWLLFTISFSPFTAYFLPCPLLFQQQLWNSSDYLTKVSKKSFGNNLSWVSPLKSCGSSANTSASNKGRRLWGVKWPNEFLSLSVLLNFFLFFFFSFPFPFPWINFLSIPNSEEEKLPSCINHFFRVTVWSPSKIPHTSSLCSENLKWSYTRKEPCVLQGHSDVPWHFFGGKNSKAICVFANCKACAE